MSIHSPNIDHNDIWVLRGLKKKTLFFWGGGSTLIWFGSGGSWGGRRGVPVWMKNLEVTSLDTKMNTFAKKIIIWGHYSVRKSLRVLPPVAVTSYVISLHLLM